MRQDLRQCLGLPEARLSPPVPRDHEEQALLSCYSCRLTSLLRSRHLSLSAWVPTSFLGSGIQHQGLNTHRVLHATWSLLSSGTRTRCCCLPQCFPMGHIQASFIVTLDNAMLPLRPGEGLQLGVRGLVLLSLAVDPFLDSAFSLPETAAGARLDFLG